MIAYLEGSVIYNGNNYLIVKVAGIGYKVFATPDLLSIAVGEPITLFTYHKSTDEGQSLFGFSSANALEFFELLLTVSGVGPKIALTILSAGPMHGLKQAIAGEDASFFGQMGGVGKKTAERIIVDLKDKIGVLDGSGGTAGASDVFEALAGLGYAPHEIRKVLVDVDRSLPTSEQLKQALKLLSKN